MSKFFQVLERVEQERASQKQRRETVLIEAVPNAAAKQFVVPPTAARLDGAWSEKARSENITRLEAKSATKQGPEVSYEVEAHLVSLLAPTTFEAEQYRTLAYTLEQLHQDAGLSVVAVSSSAVGDGKTTTAINLAGTLAQTGETRVLLIDMDLRRPSVSKLLGLNHAGKRGLTDMAQDSGLSLNDVVQPYPQFPLTILPAGRPLTAPHDVLKSPRLEILLEEARHNYDFIVLDTPPLIPFPDCRLIEKWTDGFLVVVAAHRTPRKLVEEALAVMDPAKLVGIVFNSDDRPVFGYSSYYAYGPASNGSRLSRFSHRIRKALIQR